MTQALDVLKFPLHGSRLIEASAGTGKTYTIALLYTRLILQHGKDNAFQRPLNPDEILVVTFTDAATQELKDRIRSRLAEAARCFLSPAAVADNDLQALREEYDPALWPQCARMLSLAAQAMDQAAVSTIHGWCYRMLREHTFDSGTLFQQTLISNQKDIFADLMRDYWRQHFYTLDAHSARLVQARFTTPEALLKAVLPLVNKINARLSYAGQYVPEVCDLQQALQPFAKQAALIEQLEAEARQCWLTHQHALNELLDDTRYLMNQSTYREAKLDHTFAALKQALAEWAQGGPRPARFIRFAAGEWKLKKIGKTVADQPRHLALEKIAALLQEEDALASSNKPDVAACVLSHARLWLEQALQKRLLEKAEFGFDDLLLQLDRALQGPQGNSLAARIRHDFPVAMIDEFQDTDPVQYRIFDRIYTISANADNSAVILIGDPKQSIYSFRNADIHTYLDARRATQGRHYNLTTNHRSSADTVAAVNFVFNQAEQFDAGAFRFRKDEHNNPLPFINVAARGRAEHLVIGGRKAPALTFWHLLNSDDESAAMSTEHYRDRMAEWCAAEISALLRDQGNGFRADGAVQKLQPRDIAILVRSRHEAERLRQALQLHRLPSVFLSDRDSVFQTTEAEDILFWLSACAEPADERKLRAALATVSMDIPLTELQQALDDEQYWEQQSALFRRLHDIWRTQGVLSMLRTLMQHFQLPQRLINSADGDRRLTNLLHLAEYLQKASVQYEGEQALIRHLAEQKEESETEEILRLESDSDLIRVVTIHKSKGLEYPLVFLPYAADFRAVTARQGSAMVAESDLPSETDRDTKSTNSAGRRLEIAGNKSDDAIWQQADEDRLTEDVRLLYVALTRARHALWVGVAGITKSTSKRTLLHKSALGYLMGGGKEMTPQDTANILQQWTQDCDHITCQTAPSAAAMPAAPLPELHDRTLNLKPARIALRSAADNWWIASYSALKSGGSRSSPDIARDDQVMDESIAADTQTSISTAETSTAAPAFSRQHGGLHGFHRGPGPGTFLHTLLEWATNTGFQHAATDHQQRLQELQTACELRGWHDDVQRLDQWLHGFITTDFSLSATTTPNTTAGTRLNLCELDTCQAELEFLFAVHQLDVSALDALCQQFLLAQHPRPSLQASQLNGMIKGFIDLVFVHDNQYFVADWKSNYLGSRDADYTHSAIAAEILHKRYDVQYAIYLLALHRLLRSRLPDYDYDTHIGGSVYFFLRGWQSASQGLFADKPPVEFIEALDELFLTGTTSIQPVSSTTQQVSHV